MNIKFRRFGEAWRNADFMKASRRWIQVKDENGDIHFVLPENVHPESLVAIRNSEKTPEKPISA